MFSTGWGQSHKSLKVAGVPLQKPGRLLRVLDLKTKKRGDKDTANLETSQRTFRITHTPYTTMSGLIGPTGWGQNGRPLKVAGVLLQKPGRLLRVLGLSL